MIKCKRIIVKLIVLAMIFVSSCATNELEVNETGSISSLIETSQTEITINEEVEITDLSEVTETTMHDPIHIMPQIEIDDVLPDGEYLAGILEFDEDCAGADFVINGYYALPEDEVLNFENGDIIKWGDEEREVVEVTTDNGYTFLSFDDFYFFQNQGNGFCYLRGDYDEIPFYRISDSFHLYFSDDVSIFDEVSILGLIDSYSREDALKNAYIYDSVDHLRNDMIIVREQNYHYLAGEEYWVGIHIVVEDGYVKEMYLNPSQHQSWIPYELMQQLRPQESEQ